MCLHIVAKVFSLIVNENHTAHHVLSLYALGASKSSMQAQYDDHKKSQRSLGSVNSDIVKSMQNPADFKRYLGKEEHYHDYLEFFQREITSKGYEAVVLQYLLSGSEQADDLLTRLFAGELSIDRYRLTKPKLT